MNDETKYPQISSIQQDQMLKIITKSFYNELLNYGVTKGNIVTISTNLIDCMIQDNESDCNTGELYNKELYLGDIKDEWTSHNCLNYGDVSLAPIEKSMHSKISSWLSDPTISSNLFSVIPSSKKELNEYFDKNNNKYFAILHNNNLEGVIGADDVDHISRKVEMKKFIGNFDSRGKGIGKRATFLFLYYVFSILNYNKVYIYTLNKNITNINLNSKFGFILEGILYQEKIIQGEMQDVVRMGILRNTWEEIFTGNSR